MERAGGGCHAQESRDEVCFRQSDETRGPSQGGAGLRLLARGGLQHPQAWVELGLTCGAHVQMRIHSGK